MACGTPCVQVQTLAADMRHVTARTNDAAELLQTVALPSLVALQSSLTQIAATLSQHQQDDARATRPARRSSRLRAAVRVATAFGVALGGAVAEHFLGVLR